MLTTHCLDSLLPVEATDNVSVHEVAGRGALAPAENPIGQSLQTAERLVGHSVTAVLFIELTFVFCL